MEFGLVLSQINTKWEYLLSDARRAEEAGLDSVWVIDHLLGPLDPEAPVFEAFSALGVVAGSTDRVRLGQLVTCVSFRNVGLLAKMAVTLDHASGGRLELGLGAGWYEEEYRAYGYPFPSAGVRLAQMAEALEIIQALWTQDEVSYRGEHYRLEEAICRPRPLQDPRPPIWIGGGGERVTLRQVALHADFANFGFGDPGQFRHKREVLARHCEEVGRPLEEIGLTTHIVQFLVAEDTQELDRKLDAFLFPPWEEDRIRDGGLVATVEEVIERLGELAEQGCTGVQLFFMDAVEGEGLELFAERIMPHFR